MEEDNGVSLDERISRAVLNAMQHSQQGSSDSQGLGAKLQTQRGYKTERGGRGGGRGGRGAGRGGGQFRGRPVVLPGVPDDVIPSAPGRPMLPLRRRPPQHRVSQRHLRRLP